MPKIPTYDAPSVQSRGIPNASINTSGVNADAFGAGLGRSLEQAGKATMAVGRAIDQENEKKAVADGMDASTKLNEEWNTKQQEFSQLKGKDAANIQKDFSEWYDKRATEIYGGLDDNRAKAVFDKNSRRLRMSADNWAFEYKNKQDDVYYAATMDSSITSAKQSAIFDPTPENITEQIGAIHGVYRDMALRNGMDANWVNQNTETARQGLYGEILKNAMQQDAVGSVNSFIEQYGDSVDPGLRGQAEQWVHKKNLSTETESFAESLAGGGVSYDEAIDAATKKYSGDDQDVALSKVRSIYAGRSREISKAKTMAVDAIETKAYKAGGWSGVNDDDIDALADIDAGAALRVRNAKAAELSKQAKPQKVTVSDDDKLAEASARLFDDAEDRITKPEQLEVYRPFLTKTDYNSLAKSLEKDRKVTDRQLEDAYMQYAPARLKNTPRKNWTQEQELNLFQYKKMAREAVSDSATPDRIFKDAASWWLEGNYKKKEGLTGFDKVRDAIGSMKSVTRGQAITEGRGDDFTTENEVPRDAMTEAGFIADERAKKQKQEKTIVRYGTANGRRIALFSDGSAEYVQ